MLMAAAPQREWKLSAGCWLRNHVFITMVGQARESDLKTRRTERQLKTRRRDPNVITKPLVIFSYAHNAPKRSQNDENHLPAPPLLSHTSTVHCFESGRRWDGICRGHGAGLGTREDA